MLKAFVHLGKHKLCKAFDIFFASFLFYILILFPVIFTFSSESYSRFSSETLGIKFYHLNGIIISYLRLHVPRDWQTLRDGERACRCFP